MNSPDILDSLHIPTISPTINDFRVSQYSGSLDILDSPDVLDSIDILESLDVFTIDNYRMSHIRRGLRKSIGTRYD